MIDYNSVFGYTPNLTFTLEKHLKNFSECEENARRLLESFHIIREKMEVNLRPVIALFPHYSEHSHEHSENIIAAMEKILGRERIEKLSPADTWMLLVCAYMHDLGMLVQGKELEKEWKTEAFQTHIDNCANSHDNELKKAVVNVRSVQDKGNDKSWPVHIYRDVILLASEYYRRKHPERAKSLPGRTELKQMLNVVMSSDGRIPPRIQDVIGKICFSHGTSFENMLTFLEPLDSILGYTFHPRFISAMLCLGDLCDLDNGRFNKMAIEVFGGLTKNNQIHYYKHESVTSFVIEKDVISITYDIPNRRIKRELKGSDSPIVNPTDNELQEFCDEILLETQNWIAWMEDIVKNIKLYWNELAIDSIDALSPVLNYRILIDGNTTISSKKNMRFSFSEDKAYELIESYSLYNNRLVFVRELLQNSIDALKIQFWRDILEGRWNHLLRNAEKDENGEINYKSIQPFDFSDTSVFDYYKVEIRVEHEEDEQYARFIIQDSGTGISKEDVENRIIKTGIREKSDNDFGEDMPEWLKPTSAFGIGLHSVFAVTDTLFVQTRTETDKMVYNINMHSGKLDGYIFMSVAEQQDLRFCNCTHGTKMEFVIDVSKVMEEQENFRDYENDFLGERPESCFCRNVQKMLKSVIGPMLFNVSYQFNQEQVIKCTKMCEDKHIGLLFNENRRDNLFGDIVKNAKYSFAIDADKQMFILWERTRYISMLFQIKINKRDMLEVFCKGFRVRRISMHYENAPVRIEYWGGNSRDIVNTSRNDISKKQINENKIIFEEANSFIGEIYYKILEKILEDEDIKEWQKDVLEFIEPWTKEKEDGISVPDLNDSIVKILEKYKYLDIQGEKLRIKIIKQGFCILLKKWKNIFLEEFEKLEEKERIRAIIDIDCLGSDNNESLKENTFFLEYIEAVQSVYNESEGKYYIRQCLHEIFKEEFCEYYFKYSRNRLNLEYKYTQYGSRFFGETYTNDRGLLLDIYYDLTEKNRKSMRDNHMISALKFYLSIPLTEIVFLLMKMGKDISLLHDKLCDLLKKMPGYDNDFGIEGINNAGKLIFSELFSCELDKMNDFVLDYFPFIKWKCCKCMSINADENIVVGFNNERQVMEGINFEKKALVKFLCENNYSVQMLVPAGFEKIAVRRADYMGFGRNYNSVLFRNNYVTYLWKSFNEMCNEYGPRIAAGEDKEQIIDEIVPSSRKDIKPVTNLLRNIYHNRVFDSGLKYDDAWNEIAETYRSFAALLLDCVELASVDNKG